MSGESKFGRQSRRAGERLADLPSDSFTVTRPLAETTPTPEPSEVAETTAGERECRYPCGCDQFPDEHCTCMDGHTPAEPDADEREALADLIWNNTDEPMWSAMVLAEQFMRSPWLAAHVSAAENKARADERERIAEAIEDHADQSAPRHTRRALTFAASIARGDAR